MQLTKSLSALCLLATIFVCSCNNADDKTPATDTTAKMAPAKMDTPATKMSAVKDTIPDTTHLKKAITKPVVPSNSGQ